MKIRVPQNALALSVAGLALAVAMTGTAVAVTSAAVTITDPVNAARKAKVDVTGHLLVGDGAGPLDVAGAVTSRPASPAAAFARSATTSDAFCVEVYAPPAGLAAVVTGWAATQHFHETAAGVGTFIILAVGTDVSRCAGNTLGVAALADVGTVARTSPIGLNIPAGQKLYFQQVNFASASYDFWDVDVDGYNVPAGSVPAAVSAPARTMPLHRS